VTDQDALERHAGEEREPEHGEHREPERDARLVERPGAEGAEHRHLALGEVDDPGGAEDQDECERDGRVDRARGYAVDENLNEPFHLSTPGRSGGRRRRP
jgi:hypothetical protein